MNKLMPSAGKLLGKTLLLIIIVIIAIVSVSSLFNMVKENAESKTVDTQTVEWLDYNYYQGNYIKMYETLTLYDLYDEELYGMYWEVADGARDYYDYIAWKTAASNGYDGAEQMVERCREIVFDNSSNCKYPLNKDKLEAFTENIKKEN